MVDPASVATAFTAAKIVELAFQKIVESGAGELGKKFTEAAIAKMDDLRKTIWAKLRGKSDKVDEALTKAEQGDRTAINTVAKYLDVAMEDYPDFATEVQAIAHEINAGKLIDQSHMTQNNYDNAKGWQTKIEGGTAFIGENHINHPLQ